MGNVWSLAALWIGLALVATLLAIWFRVSTALSEIVVGTVAQLIVGVRGGATLGGQTPWITFLAGTGAIVLTFLDGASLDPTIFRTKWKEATVVGLAGFFAPFLGVAAIAHYVPGWPVMQSWLAGVSHLVAAVIGSAVIPTLIANALFMPRHLLPDTATPAETVPDGAPAVRRTT